MNDLDQKHWLAFYTRPRNEKKAAESLSKKGYQIYCPTRTVLKQWSDRKKKVQEPLFTSYLFALVNESERQKILTDPAIVSTVYWLGKPAIIKQNEIDEIRRFLADFADSDSKKITVSHGDMASITSGPLRGEEGEVKEKRGNKVVLQIKSLGLEIQAVVSLSKLELAP